MAHLPAVQSAAKGAVVEGTAAKQTCAWDHYKRYLFSIGLHDDWFLENFSKGAKHTILSAFAQSVRGGQYCPRYSKQVKSESVRSSLEGVA